MKPRHLADTPSVGTCPRRKTNATFRDPVDCKGVVRAWEFGNWYGRALWADDFVACPEHRPEGYARRLFHGAAHKGRRKWWKR